MQTYLVGGAIRDELLGITPHEFDYVVVGATQQDMLKAGYLQVGQDFPVFLHPKTKAEYALARTERKTGNGYKGFVFATQDVSLKEDLSRRDITINAIAKDDAGDIIDFYNGIDDLNNRIIRHVSAAFIEDPVRILRVARFMAKLSKFNFKIAPETLDLMKEMVSNGEINHLVPERVWAETFKALNTNRPDIFFTTLRDCNALEVIFPEVNALFGVVQRAEYHPEIDTGVHVMLCLANSAQRNYSPQTRYAVLCHDLGKAKTPADILPRHHGHEQRGIEQVKAMNNRLKVPKEYAKLAEKTVEYHSFPRIAFELTAKKLLALFKVFSAIKDDTEFLYFLDACLSDTQGRLGFEQATLPQSAYLIEILNHLKQLNNANFILPNMSGEEIKLAIHNGQINFIKNLAIYKNRENLREL